MASFNSCAQVCVQYVNGNAVLVLVLDDSSIHTGGSSIVSPQKYQIGWHYSSASI
jgi:hypothetical protein